MGAHLGEAAGRRGVNFAVWSPNARQASVIGDCNGWNPQPNALGSRGAIGVWEGLVPDVEAEARYKYHIASQCRDYEVDKAGPLRIWRGNPAANRLPGMGPRRLFVGS